MKQKDLNKFHKIHQRQIQSHRHTVQVEVHASMEFPEPEVPMETKVSDEPLDSAREPLIQKVLFQQSLWYPCIMAI